MEKTKRNILVLILSLICIIGVTFLARFVNNISIRWVGISALVGINLLIGLVAFIAMKLTKMEIKIDFKNRKQYLIGAVIALILSVCIAFIPAICGNSLVGEYTDFSLFKIIYSLIFYLLVIGPVEEFVFRVYLQDVFVGFFAHHQWIGVVIAAFLFGLWHLINGSMVQVLFTFGIGLVFGFAKYKIKSCGYAGVALAHGLYDFLNTIVRMFIV